MNLFFRKNSQVDYSSLTDGEFYVACYLEELGFEIETQKVLNGLSGDTKTHRRADFYLPECDLIIEYNGQWDVNEFHRNRYREKRKVLLKNNLNLVEIYPNQLGIIDYSLPRKIRQALTDRHQNRHLKIFNWKMFWSDEDAPGAGDLMWLAFLGWVTFSAPKALVVLLPLTLPRIWEILCLYQREITHQRTGKTEEIHWDYIFSETTKMFRRHDITISTKNVVDFLMGHNEAQFSEVVEAEHYRSLHNLPIVEIAERFRQFSDDGRKKPDAPRNRASRESHALLAAIAELEIPTNTSVREEQLRKIFRRSHCKWSAREDELLLDAYSALGLEKLPKLFNRSEGALKSRLTKLGVDAD